MGIAWGSVSGGGGLDELAVDRLELAASRSLEGVCGDAIGVAEATAGCLVEHGERVGGEDTLLAARLLEAVADVLGGIGWGGLAEVEPGMHPRPKGAVLAQSHAVVHLGQADQDRIPCTNRRCCGACRVSRLSGAWRAQQSGPDGWRHGGGAA